MSAVPVPARFAEQVARTPAAAAVTFEGRSLGYAELDLLAGRLAGRLRTLGVGRGTRVGLLLERSLDLPVAILGVWKAGGAYVPLDPYQPAARLSFLLDDAVRGQDAPVLVGRQLPDLDLSGIETLLLDGLEEGGPALAAPVPPVPPVSPDDPAYLIYTSGTTGAPKAVLVEHGNLAHTLSAVQAAFDFRPSDRMPCLAAFTFDIFLFELLGPLLAGGTSVLFPLRPGLDLAALVESLDGMTLLHAVPALMREVVETAERKGRGRALRRLFVGGDTVPEGLLADLRRVFPAAQVTLLYGPTEATIVCSHHEGERVRLGRPLAECRLELRDGQGEPVPDGAAGELWIGGPGVARGYLHQPELTGERFRQEAGVRWYRSGDLARRLPDGLEFLGRIDNQVKIRGFRVELGEIEAVLLQHPAVRQTAVVAVGEGAARRLAAFAVAEPEAREPALRAFLADRLPEYMVPSSITLLAALPLTGHGKVDRRELARLAPVGPVAEADWQAPRTATEVTLAELWAEVLGMGRVGLRDHFFALGGHSLLATRLVSRIADVLEAELPLRAVFEAPVLAELAARLDAALAAGPGLAVPRIVPVRREGDLPLSFAQERLWFLYQLDPESPHYNISAALRLTGRLDVPALRASLTAVVRRHEALRTHYAERAGVGAQRVAAPWEATLPVADLRGVPDPPRAAEALRLIREEEGLPFDLRRGPVGRFRLVRTGDEAWLLFLSAHHISSDGWSMGLLLREMGDLYSAFSRRWPLSLPEPAVQYGDFAVWQRQWLQGEALEGLLGHWRRALEEPPVRIDLPADRPRPAVQTHRGATRALTLPPGLVAQAEAAGHHLGATLFMTLLGAFAALLHRITGQDDLLIGTPVAGRTRSETEGLIGCFVNTLVLRSRLPEARHEASFRDLVEDVRSVALGAYAHQGLPFEKLVEGLEVERSLSWNPLFQAFFALQNAPLASPALHGIEMAPVEAGSESALFDLTLGLGEFQGRLLGGFQYNVDLFEAATVDRWARHFLALLEGALANPDLPLSALPGIPEPERRQLLADAAAPEAEELQARLSAREGEVAERRSVLSDGKRAALEKLMRAKGARRPATAEPAPSSIPRRPGAGPAVLSFGQERLWFLDRLEPGGTLYNITTALRLDGRLDRAALQQSLDELVRRHEVLRTAFTDAGGVPLQVVRPPEPVAIRTLDLRGLPAARREGELRRLVELPDQIPFDLQREPLVRCLLVWKDDESRALLLGYHHIVCDGWSFGVVVNELAALYGAYCQGKPSPLPELPIQYTDFAEWQRSRLQEESLAAQLDWWKRELAGAPTKLDLPLDRPRPAEPASHGAAAHCRFPAGMAGLRQREGATSFMLYLALFQALLARYCGQDDLLVGVPVADRRRLETIGLIGFFVNTLVLRGRLAPPLTFRELLGRTRESVLGAFAHQDLPFERLVDELEEERDTARSPIFQATFSLRNEAAGAGSMELPGLVLTPIDFAVAAAKFELDMALTEEPSGEARCAVQYNVALFDAATAERLLRHYRTLLDGAHAEPDRPLEEIPLLTAPERQQLLVEWNDRAVRTDGACVHWLVAERAAAAPEALAVAGGGARLTYGELDRRAARLAWRLRRLGVREESLVAVCLERSPELVTAVLAVLAAGGAYLPLDPDHPAERLAYTLKDSGAVLCLGRKDLLAVEEAGPDEADSPAAAGPGDLAYVIYTSGSTGPPKGAELRHGGLANLVAWHRRTYGLAPADRCTLLAGPAFDASVWEMWPALAAGASLHIPPPEIVSSAPDLLRWLAEERITVSFLPTPLAEAVLAEPVPDGLALRALLTGGDRLLRRPRPEHPFVLVNHYGPTECTVVATAEAVAVKGIRPPTIGRPVDNLRVFLLDRSFQPVPAGVHGELCLAGVGLARGYRGRPRLTAEKFVPDPFGAPGSRLYRTGDLARRLPDGLIEFLGRIDQQVKIRGFRIEPGEIEAALMARPEIREAAVLVSEAEDAGEKRLTAYLAPREGAEIPSPHALRDALAAGLPSYMVPAAFVVLDALPLNTSGKVDRKALARIRPEPVGEGPAADVRLTATEEILAGVWSGLLGTARVRPSDDFFDLGGHSLLATRLVSRIRAAFGIELSLRTVFQAATLGRLAGRIDEAVREAGGIEAPPVVPLSPEERGPWPPLSFAQERLWFLDRLEPGGALYNVPAALRATGALDVAALAAAVDGIVQRHEALRTIFGLHQGVPFQIVAPILRVPLPVVDLGALPEERREPEAHRLLAAESVRTFDLAAGPLLRALLVRLDTDDWVMLLDLHHIVSDGWSVGVLTGELAALYTAAVERRPSPLPSLPVQYADFAVWQRSWLRGGVLAGQIAYWKERLQGVRMVLDLPADRPRPPVQTFRGAHRPFELPTPLPEALRTLGRKEGTTLFMTLLAGLQTLLHRYTGQEDILVGTPVAGRTRHEVEGLIGFFVNTLVLRGEVRSPTPQSGAGFRELLGQVRSAALGAYAHQDLPFERLVDELRIERNLARNPVYQVVFTFDTPARPLELPGLSLSPLAADSATAKVDLLLGITEAEPGRSEALHGSWEHSADLFDPATIDRMSAHLRVLLEAAAADPDRPVAELPLLTGAEQEQLSSWGGTGPPGEPEACLHDLFEAWAARRPQAPAVLFNGRSLTYGELDERAEWLARRLRGLGVGPESLVGIFLDRGIERIVAVLGVFKAGGAYVPLDPSHPPERLAWMLADSRAAVLVTESGLADALPRHDAATVCLDQDDAAPARSATRLTPDHLAYVIYTSGSTGRPNGVLVRHGSAVNLVRRAIDHFLVRPDSRLLQSVSFSFDASVLETWMALASGAALCVASRDTLLSGAALAGAIRRDGITTAVLTPSVLSALPQEDLPTLAVVGVGGESCPGGLASRWSPPGSGLRRFLNCYGPTETTIYTTVHVCSGPYRKEPPIGRPVEGTRACVLDFHGQLVPQGVPGALWIGGAGVARGYLGRPRLTAERFGPDPFGRPGDRLYRTGDLARWNADGELEFLGRIDRQVKVRGLRIELGEIEAALGSHPRLREVAVLVREDGRGKRLAACAVAGPPERGEEELPPLSSQDLREHLRSRLPDYMVPASFTFLEALPRTPTGKVDRDALLRLELKEDGTGRVRVGPRDGIELELVHIWREALGVPDVGVRDNFFEAGGHSLLAVRLMARIQQRFGRELPLSVLFQGGTIEEMAVRLRGETLDVRPSSLVPIQPSGTKPPLFFVHPAGGDVLCFAALSRHLGPEQPFYGFQSAGLTNDEAPLSRIEDMAARYIAEMRRVQPEGPYRLGGWSLGGVIAFEMARQLRQSRDGVALLAILDSAPDLTAEAAGFRDDVDFLLDMAAYVEGLWSKEVGLTREALEGLDPDARLAAFVEKLRQADFLPPGAGVDQLGRILRVYKANAAAAGAYRPGGYTSAVTLFRAADVPPAAEGPLSEPDLGWHRVSGGCVDVRSVPGQHLTLLAEPHVIELARQLGRLLEEMEQG